jgi:hypothetical protein
MAGAIDIELTLGDRLPVLRIAFYQPDKTTPHVLTSPRILVTPIGGGAAVIDYAAMAIDPLQSHVATYAWDADDTLTAGDYWVQYRDTDGDGKHIHFPPPSRKHRLRITAAG